MLDAKAIGELIRTKRKELKITQKELSKELGVVNTGISKYERGEIKFIPIDIRLKLIDLLDIDPRDIMPENEIDTYFLQPSSPKGANFNNKLLRRIETMTEKEQRTFWNKYYGDKIRDFEKSERYIKEYLSKYLEFEGIRYIRIGKHALVINTSGISEEDLERIIGIVGKYGLPENGCIYL